MSARTLGRLLACAFAVTLAAPAPAGAVTSRDVRVVGGAFAAPGQFPWMAALVDASARRAVDGIFCGGAVIAPRVVLTAAHCLEDVRLGEVDVVTGRTRLSVESDGDRVRATRLLPHPRYDPREVVNDIALVQLDRPVAVPLLPLAGAGAAPPGTRVITSGWGRTSERGPTSDPLRFVRLTTRSLSTCTRRYGALSGRTQLCAGANRAAQDSCQGDSGGPLFAGEDAAARVVGVVSYGDGCGRRGVPGVYTSVAGFTDWIARTAAELNGDAPAPPAPAADPPRVRIGSIRCGARLCTVRLRVSGRQPAGGIVLNATRARGRGRAAVDRYVLARRDAGGRWSGRIDLPVGRVTLYAFPLNAAQDDVDGDGDVETLRVSSG